MNELYKMMVDIRTKYYETGEISIGVALFFRLFKMVCDMRQIERIVEDQ